MKTKTITQRVDELLEQLIYCDLRTSVDTDKAKALICKALKEEHKLTRHACADNVLTVIELEHSNQIWITRDGVLESVMNTVVK